MYILGKGPWRQEHVREVKAAASGLLWLCVQRLPRAWRMGGAKWGPVDSETG